MIGSRIANRRFRGKAWTRLLRSGRLAGLEWRDLVALTPLKTARELALSLPWLALAAERGAGAEASDGDRR